MPRHKVTFEFESTTGNAATSGSKSGWSESWYDGVDTDDDTAEARAVQLAAARRGILTVGWSLPSIRISQLDAGANLLRKGRLVFVPPADAPGRYTGANIDEQAYDALEISISAANGSHRAFGLRGIGNDVVNAGSRFLNPPQFASKFAAWQNAIKGIFIFSSTGAYSIRFRTLIATVDNPSGVFNIANVITEPAGGLVASPASPQVFLDTPVALGTFPAGSTLVIKGVLGMQRINGTWKVLQQVSTTGIRLAPKRRNVTAGVATPVTGTVRGFAYALSDIVGSTPEYGTSRRTGRPLQLVRGRRSNSRD